MQMKLDNHKIWVSAKDYFFIVFGILLYGIGFSGFIAPYGVITGGMAGAGQVVFYATEKLFGFGHGQGYPPERMEPEMRNKRILDEVRTKTLRPWWMASRISTRSWSRALWRGSGSRSCFSPAARTRPSRTM